MPRGGTGIISPIPSVGAHTGTVYVDDTLGVAGTATPLGTPTHPVSNLTDALTIAGNNNLRHLHVHGSHTVVAGIAGFYVEGDVGAFSLPNITLVAAVSIANCTFQRCFVTGDANGWAFYNEGSILYDVTGIQGVISDCNLYGNIRIANGISDFNYCTTIFGAITFNAVDLAAPNTCRFHQFAGTMTITNLTGGNIRVYSSEGANVTIDASCTGGTIELYGCINLIDNSGAGCTVNDYTTYTRTRGLDDIHDDVNNVFNLVNAILTLTETGSTITTTGAVQNLYINETPAGVFEPKIVQIDFSNQTAAETVVIRESYRIKEAAAPALGAYIEKDAVTFTGVQNPKLKNVILEPNRFGVKVTIEKTAGANKDYDWGVLYKI